jgi:acyl carrier protein
VSDEETRAAVIGVLKSIAPELEEAGLAPDRPLRDQIDLDSMDWLNVIVALHERFKVDIPEADYAKLVTLTDVVAYLAKRQATLLVGGRT